MKSLIKYTKLSGIFVGLIIVTSFLFALLNLIGVSFKVTTIIGVIIMIILFLIMGIIEGINSEKKGFIAGFKIGLLFIVIMLLLNLVIFQSKFSISRLIYYIILLFSSIFGAMIGINRKKKE